MRSRSRQIDESVVEGAPLLAVADEDRESLSDILSEMLISSLERDEEPAK